MNSVPNKVQNALNGLLRAALQAAYGSARARKAPLPDDAAFCHLALVETPSLTGGEAHRLGLTQHFQVQTRDGETTTNHRVALRKLAVGTPAQKPPPHCIIGEHADVPSLFPPRGDLPPKAEEPLPPSSARPQSLEIIIDGGFTPNRRTLTGADLGRYLRMLHGGTGTRAMPVLVHGPARAVEAFLQDPDARTALRSHFQAPQFRLQTEYPHLGINPGAFPPDAQPFGTQTLEDLEWLFGPVPSRLELALGRVRDLALKRLPLQPGLDDLQTYLDRMAGAARRVLGRLRPGLLAPEEHKRLETLTARRQLAPLEGASVALSLAWNGAPERLESLLAAHAQAAREIAQTVILPCARALEPHLLIKNPYAIVGFWMPRPATLILPLETFLATLYEEENPNEAHPGLFPLPAGWSSTHFNAGGTARLISWPTVPQPISPALLPPPPEEIRPAFAGGQQPDRPLEVTLTAQLKVKADPRTELQLELDSRRIELFNPVMGKATGLRHATLWRPVIERQGLGFVAEQLGALGYGLRYPGALVAQLDRRAKRRARIQAPLYELTPYEKLAYHECGPAQAQATILDPLTGEPLWFKGKEYPLRPSWETGAVTVDDDVRQSLDRQAQAGIETAGARIDTVARPEAATPAAAPAGEEAPAPRPEGGPLTVERVVRCIHYRYATFYVGTERGDALKIREIDTADSRGAELERLAAELDRLQGELDQQDRTLEEIARLQAAGQTNDGALTRSRQSVEARARELRAGIDRLQAELDAPRLTIETFLEAFDPPVPPLASVAHGEAIKAAAAAIQERFSPKTVLVKPADGGPAVPVEIPIPTLKTYQVRDAALLALKRSALLSTRMGGGKTLTTIAAAWRLGNHYCLVICPTRAMKGWAEELERCGLYHELIGHWLVNGMWQPHGNGLDHLRRVVKRLSQNVRTPNRLGRIETEFYVVSSELLALGAEGNQRYNLWHHDYLFREELQDMVRQGGLRIPEAWQVVYPPPKIKAGQLKKAAPPPKPHLRVWSDSYDNARHIRAAGWEGLLPTMRFHDAVLACPACGAEAPVWTEKGFCGRCKHAHYSTSAKPLDVRLDPRLPRALTVPELMRRGIHATAPLPPGFRFLGVKTSNRQYPAYRLVGKAFPAKIIDEVHTVAGFTSLHGKSVQNVRAKNRFALSGTPCRTLISELEPLLCLLHKHNSAQFPYSNHDMSLFRRQFCTTETQTHTEYRVNADGEFIPSHRPPKRRVQTRDVPEASNLPRLRAMIHGIQCFTPDAELDREWNMEAPLERVVLVPLRPKAAQEQDQWINELIELARQRQQTAQNALQRDRTLARFHQRVQRYFQRLQDSANGPEKIEAALEWIRRMNAEGHRCVIACRSKNYFELIARRFKEQNVPLTLLGDNVPSDQRHEALTRFAQSSSPNLLTRSRLIATNFNQLVCCSRGLFMELDPSPSIVRQTQRRLCRPGQTQRVAWTFLLTCNPGQALAAVRPKRSYEKTAYDTLLRREKAIKETLHSVDRPRSLAELAEQAEEREAQNQILEELIQEGTRAALAVELTRPAPEPTARTLEPGPADAPAASEPTPVPETPPPRPDARLELLVLEGMTHPRPRPRRKAPADDPNQLCLLF